MCVCACVRACVCVCVRARARVRALLMTLQFDLGRHDFVVMKKILSNLFKC